MPQPSTSHVFISYSRKDTDAMIRIVSYLREQGINAWVDNEKLVPGTPIWEREIEKAIDEASAIVVVLSPDAKESVWVLNELTLADEYKKRVFPVLVRGDFRESIHFRLVTRQFVDIRTNEMAGLESLSSALSNYLDELKRLEEKRRAAEQEKELEKQEKAERLAAEKAEAERLASQKAEEERLATEKLQAEQKIHEEEEAKRIAIQKAEVQRISNERAIKAERQEKEKAERFAAQKAEEERVAKAKIEAERQAKEEANRLIAQKAEDGHIAKAQPEAANQLVKNKAENALRVQGAIQQPIANKVLNKETKPAKSSVLSIGIAGVALLTLVICGFAATRIFPSMFGGQTPTITDASPTSSLTQDISVNPTVKPTSVSTSPVTITWWYISTADNHKALLQTKADEYMALHPNVTIEITVLDYQTFKTQLTTIMQSGDTPDIFQSWGGSVMNEYANAGLLKDITTDLDADGNAWRKTFSPGTLGVYTINGKNYGVPWDMGMVGFWYNKDLFAEAGIVNPPATWTEFLDDVSALNATGITPIALGEGDKWPGQFWWAYLATRICGQAGFEAAVSRSGSFADPCFVEAGLKLQELTALEPFQDGFLSATYGDDATIIGNGKAAMELMGPWAPIVYSSNSTAGKDISDKLGWFPFPAVEGGTGDPSDAFGGGNGYIIGKNAPPEAVDFVKFLSSVDMQTELAKLGLALPVVKGGEAGLTDPFLITIQKSSAAAKYFQLYYDQALPTTVVYVVNDSVQGIFAGTLTPEQAAQAVEDSFTQELK